ncbi:MAG: FAD-dependent oxidoreductase [Candidatus Xenobia bacterium]
MGDKNLGGLFRSMRQKIAEYMAPPPSVDAPFETEERAVWNFNFLRMLDFYDEGMTTHKSDYYPGTRWSPCINGCPAHTDARGYVTLAGEQQFGKGLGLLKKTYPFLGTLGHICPAPCEDVCVRGVAGPEPISIRRVKRFYADWEASLPEKDRFNYKSLLRPPIGKRAAVIGAGPSGIVASLELAIIGFEVTCFERASIPMGYVGLTIPKFRVRDQVWMREVDSVAATDRVEFRYNTTIGEDITFDDLCKAYDVVVIAAGATRPSKLRIPGEDGIGMVEGEPWLENIKLGRPVEMGQRVVVVGGGSTSTDCARCALRMGAKEAIITYRRTRAEMPAAPLEVEDALEEGAKFEFLITPIEVVRNEKGRTIGLKCQRNKLGPRDEKGRRSPVPIPGSEFVMECDLIVTSLGRSGALRWVPEDVQKDKGGLIIIKDDGESSRPNVYACGDSTRVSTMIASIAGAKKAVHGIAKKFGISMLPYKDLYATAGRVPLADGTHIKEAPVVQPAEPPPPPQSHSVLPTKHDKPFMNHPYKIPMPMQDHHVRLHNWDECELGFDENAAVTEGRRCLSCETEMCISCGICVDNCPDQVIYLHAREVEGRKDVVFAEQYTIDTNICCKCRSCVTACPTKSIVAFPEQQYELSQTDRDDNWITKERLRVGSTQAKLLSSRPKGPPAPGAPPPVTGATHR